MTGKGAGAVFAVATEPRADGTNEDFAVTAGDLAIVVDGAGVPAGIEQGCRHGVAWYARHLALGIADALVDHLDTALADGLAQAIEAVNALHRDDCDLTCAGTPSAAVGILRLRPDAIDVLSLADVTIAVRGDQGVRTWVDLDIERICPPEPEALAGLRLGTPEHAAALAELVRSQQAVRNQPDGFWVAATDPAAAAHAVTSTFPRAGITRAAVLSDGATRPVDQMGLADWPDYLDLLAKLGPAGLISHVRAIEIDDPDGVRFSRTKRHDDATVISIDLEPLVP